MIPEREKTHADGGPGDERRPHGIRSILLTYGKN